MPKIGLAVILCAAVGGFCMAAQGGISGTLRDRLVHPLHTSLISFVVGTIALVALCLAWTRSLPRPAAVLDGPWWTLTGGLLGGVVVTTSLLMVPRIGATAWLATLVCAQFIAAVILDHFAWAGTPHVPLSWGRLAGVTLIILGVVLVTRS